MFSAFTEPSVPQSHPPVSYETQLLPPSVPELTGLRGVAVILVTLFHGGYPPVIGGSLGVDIFFVLSGFLITSLLIREQAIHDRIDIRNFYLRRLLRLGPALVLMLVGLVVYAAIFTNAHTVRHTAVDALVTLFYLQNWTRAFSFHEPIFLGHTWSLSIEEQFYIVWPFLYVVLTRFRRRTRLSVVIILAALPLVLRVAMQHSGVSLTRIYNGFDTRADDLLVGCALALFWSQFGNRLGHLGSARRSLSYVSVGAAGVLIALSLYLKQMSAATNYFGYTLVQLACVLIIMDVLNAGDSPVKRVLRNRGLQWFGKVSYSLYLWHFPLCIIFLSNGFTQRQTSGMALSGALLTAALSYYLVETRFLRMKRLFESDRRGRVDEQGVETVPSNAAG